MNNRILPTLALTGLGLTTLPACTTTYSPSALRGIQAVSREQVPTVPSENPSWPADTVPPDTSVVTDGSIVTFPDDAKVTILPHTVPLEAVQQVKGTIDARVLQDQGIYEASKTADGNDFLATNPAISFVDHDTIMPRRFAGYNGTGTQGVVVSELLQQVRAAFDNANMNTTLYLPEGEHTLNGTAAGVLYISTDGSELNLIDKRAQDFGLIYDKDRVQLTVGENKGVEYTTTYARDVRDIAIGAGVAQGNPLATGVNVGGHIFEFLVGKRIDGIPSKGYSVDNTEVFSLQQAPNEAGARFLYEVNQGYHRLREEGMNPDVVDIVSVGPNIAIAVYSDVPNRANALKHDVQVSGTPWTLEEGILVGNFENTSRWIRADKLTLVPITETETKSGGSASSGGGQSSGGPGAE